MAPGHPAEALAMVLVGTSHPGNIGAAARAMKTMGLSRLCLVAAECDPFHADAWAMAAGADDLISAAWQGDSLVDALADCSLVFGATARRRSVPLPELAPREAAAAALAEVARGGRVAMLFGRERSGLENEELQRCHLAIHIPTDPTFSSLNLAAAVQVMAYELRIAMLASQPAEAAAEPRDAPASHALMEGLFEHLDRTLHAIDFHKGRSPETVMQRLRRLFLRAAPDEREVRILRGILADAERMARLAQDASRP
jgi:tRNA (cytidine32/uridine32-2'-O)-methyltransferase